MFISERTRPRLLAFLIPATLAAFLGCIKDMDQREVDPLQVVSMSYLFSHDDHREVIRDRGLNCLSCHPEKQALSSVIKSTGPGRRFKCHDCHRNTEMEAKAPQRCVLCHTDLKPVEPADHRLDWKQRHAVFSRLDDFKCMGCHERSTCTNCHLQRDTIQQTVHARTFRYYHSVEARGNPHACGSCHQIGYCRDCHTRRGVSF
ncbi:MAG: cytochrome c3 family protein [Pseudomonadota bacterium]